METSMGPYRRRKSFCKNNSVTRVTIFIIFIGYGELVKHQNGSYHDLIIFWYDKVPKFETTVQLSAFFRNFSLIGNY